MKPFDPTKPVQTKSGKKVRIVCVDRKTKDFPVLALIDTGLEFEFVASFTIKGCMKSSNAPSQEDLVNIPERKWINIYTDGGVQEIAGFARVSKKDCDITAKQDRRRRVACLSFVEGDGLEEEVKD